MRYALYFTPPMSDPLTRVATNWLGRDAFSGEMVEPPTIGGLSTQEIMRHTAGPRRYGFHATLKAPFHLAPGGMAEELLAEIMHFTNGMEPFELPRLRIDRLGPFFALTLSAPSEELQVFVDEVVRHFEPFRAPLSEAELERRTSERLTERQLEYLHRWGYPYVFDEFRFHMTLTGPVAEAEAPRVERALHALFEPVLSEPVEVSALALFVEAERGAPFVVDSLHPLGPVETKERAAGR